MRRVVVLLALVVAGCRGPAPLSPSITNDAAASAAQTTVSQAVAQAMAQFPLTPSTAGNLQDGVSIPCPDGGSMAMTFDSAWPPVNGMVVDYMAPRTSTMRFNDCRTRDVVMRGDPSLSFTDQLLSSDLSNIRSTMHIGGGLRFESAAGSGRVVYDCTFTITTAIDQGGAILTSNSSSGTIAWEQPIGTIVTRPCAPA